MTALRAAEALLVRINSPIAAVIGLALSAAPSVTAISGASGDTSSRRVVLR